MTLPATPLKWRKIIRANFSSAQNCLQTISPSKATDLNKRREQLGFTQYEETLTAVETKKHLQIVVLLTRHQGCTLYSRVINVYCISYMHKLQGLC